MVTGVLQVLFINVYALLYPGGTFSVVTPLVYKEFYFLLDILIEPFSLTTPVGDSVVSRRVFWICPISLTNSFTLVD